MRKQYQSFGMKDIFPSDQETGTNITIRQILLEEINLNRKIKIVCILNHTTTWRIFITIMTLLSFLLAAKIECTFIYMIVGSKANIFEYLK